MKVAINEFAFSGINILDPNIFKQLNYDGKFSIIEAYLKIAKNKKIVGYDHTGTNWIDVGKPENLLEASSFL